MPVYTVNLGGYHRTSTNGVHQWGDAQTFFVPSYVTPIKSATITFDTYIDSGDFAYKRFYINQVAGNTGVASGTKMSTAQIRVGQNNGFSTGMASAKGKTAQWQIVNIKLNISYGGDPGTMTLNKSSMDAGETVRVSLGKADAGVKRTVKAYFGSESSAMATLGTNLDSTAQYVDWEFPIESCNKMPSANSGTVKIKMTGSEGGEVVKNLTVWVPEDVLPELDDFTAELVPNGVPEEIDLYVQGKSKCLLSILGAEGALGSTITGYKITGPQANGNAAAGIFGPFLTTGEIVFTARVTDSRGRWVEENVTINVKAYNSPSFDEAAAYRANAAGSKDNKGTYIRMYSKAKHSALEGENPAALHYRVWQKGAAEPETWTAMTVGEPLIYGGGTVTVAKTYMVKLRVSDLMESRTMEFVIPTKRSVFSVMRGLSGQGLVGGAIGKVAEIVDALEIPWSNIFLKDGLRVLKEGDAEYLGRNVLHNWDFRNPVNQRGVSGTISSGTYFYDMWVRMAGSVTVGAGYLTLASGATIEQRIEGHDLVGETVTLSVRVGNDVFSGSAVFPASGTESIDLGDFGTGILGYHATCLYVRFTADGAQDVVAVKLETGDKSTLHLDPPMDYADQQYKCFRYCQVLNPFGVSAARIGWGWWHTTTGYLNYIPYVGGMRTCPPTVSVLKGTFNFATAPSTTHCSDGLLYCLGTGTGGTVNAMIALAANSGAKLLLSSEFII